MVTIIMTTDVKNYSEWRKVYDGDADNRSKAGIKMTGVYQVIDNPNKVILIGEAPSVEAITTFMSNPALKEAMEKGGVIGMPDLKMLSKT